MHFDDAFDFLVETLAASPDATGLMGRNARNATYGNDVWLPKIAEAYWQPRMAPGPLVDLEDGHFRPFYDAAWELARIGVLRPGAFAPRGRAMGNELFSGDGFSITQFGREWLRCASNRPVRDPSRLADVLNAFAPKFGAGYAQRATEAVATYRTSNYLAACVMSGAAAESVLLSLAIAKEKDEAKVLAMYRTSGGRGRVTKLVTSSVAVGLAAQLATALQVLHYWRDDAGHGTMTTITETEAHASLTQLLRLAHFASDHWPELTASGAH
jgi:hypothetical protein